MKNLNLINQERRLGGHDFCGVNHANQTEVQTDNLSVSGRSKVSMTLDEQPCNHPVITPLSPRNHPLLPKQKSGKSLIRIGKNVAESHVRKYAGASRMWKYAAMVVSLLTLGVGQMWADDLGYNGESHVYLKINGTTSYYKVSTESWDTGASLPGTWGGALSSQTFRSILNIQIVGGAVGGWTNSGYSLSGSLFYKVTQNSSKPSSWDSFGTIAANNTYGTGDKSKNCFYYKNNGSTEVTPHSAGTYYLHVKIVDGQSNERYSYVAFTVPPFTVTGANTTIFGSAWDATNADNDMSWLSGTTYKLTKENFELTSGTSYEYKVVINHAWDENYPSGSSNASFSVAANGHYNITFSFNASTKDVSAATTLLYKVTYNANDGSGTRPADSYHLSGSTVTVADKGALDKSNYSFAGWNTNNSGSGTNYAAGSGTFTMPASNKTLYAKWTQSVTLNANTSNGGSGSNGSATATWNGTALSGISHPSGATGYTRTGYFTDATGGTKVLDANGTYAGSDITGYITGGKWSRTEATTLYAQWDNHYTVTFEQGSPTFQGTGEVEATYGAALPAISVPSKTGYIFGGYYTGENGTGTQYYNENGVGTTWGEAANTTLHAKWTGIRYQVAFDANEGSGTIANQNLTYGAAATALTSNTTQITRTGYYFLGWNTNADGSGTAFYNGKAVQNLTSVDGGIVTLYAQWAKTYTLYFVQADCDWTPPYAKAEISYDGQTYYPLGESNGASMSDVEGDITLSEITYNGNHIFNLFSIDGVPEGSLIKFSNNGSSPTSNMSWSTDKPYFIYGNRTWYGLDAESPRTISQATNMVVHMGDGSEYGIDKHGDEEYAIVELNGSTEYRFKYYNWLSKSWSGAKSNDDKPYLINQYTTTGVSNTWGLDGDDGGKDVYMYTTVTGEYKFKLTWSSSTPQTTVYYPVGVSLAIDKTEAHAGEETTVTLTATPAKTYLMTNPTYYYQMSTDGGTNWTTIATSSSNTYAYTFAARACKFRVMLQNDAGLRSKSNEQSFTAYSTKSFYVYNPYNDDTNKWHYLHLYTWDSNNGNTTYNGSWPGGYIHGVDNAKDAGCANGNTLEYKGDNWFKITIDERANCFMLVGESPYNDHQTVTCYTNGYIEGGKYMIYTQDNKNKVVEYQAKGASDFRLKYTDGSGKELYSDIYNTTLDGTSVIASLWMNASASSPTLVIQRGSGNNTWSDAVTYSGTGFTNLIPDTKEDHGYVFQMDLNLSTPAVSNVTEYTGPFYVRTDGLEGGWNAYKNNSKNTMYANTATSPAYDYYLCKWIGSAGTNVKFTVANDYNKELVASLGHDVILGNGSEETLPAAANVRFAWNSQTNTLSRAYISGSTNASDRFLVMTEKASDAGYTTGKIYNESGVALTTAAGGAVAGLNEHELIFTDNGNWVYQLVMFANPGAHTEVTAKFGTHTQEFIPMGELIGGSGSSKQKYRIVYDFKTNILTTAWVPNGPVNADISLNANVMLIRNGQNAAEELTFEEKGGGGGHYSITNAQKLISVMQFDYDNMVGKMNSWNSQAYQYCMYYISFPFDVDVNKIFGIGTYGTDWKLQYYDGAERASKGFFRGDGTTTFWKDVPANGKLDKYVGYSLLLNRIKFNDGSSDIWENKGAGSSVYLYFPSNEDAGTIKDDGEITIPVPEHKCEINRTFTVDDGNGGTRTLNHMNTDSHWNMMGTPLFEHKTASTIAVPTAINEETLQYFYAWNYADNTLSAKAALANGVQTFNAMQAYMVQYAGNVTFSGAAIHPSVAARRTAETRNLNIELQVLNANEEEINRTYVQLKDGADADFKLNEDMYMVTNSRAVNIYTYAGDYDVAANVLPLETTTVPVGVTVKTAGTYTFSMPSNFSGTATLVDTYAQTRTNLALEDYTVQLEKGTVNDRFFLEIGINNAPTAIDGVTDGSGSLKDGKAHKYIENGAMYILREGVIYDARGTKVK